MKKAFIMLSGIFLLLVGCSKETDGIKFKNEYEGLNGKESASGNTYISLNISDKNIIKYKTIDEIIDIIKNETGIIYFGYPQCPWCRSTIGSLFEAASSTSLKNIYYLNMYDIRDRLSLDETGNVITEIEAKKGYSELLDTLSSVLDDYILTDSNGNEVNTGEKRIYVPAVIFVKDGNIVDYHIGTVASQIDPYISLTTQQNNELVSIYKEGILKTINNSCTDEGKC